MSFAGFERLEWNSCAGIDKAYIANAIAAMEGCAIMLHAHPTSVLLTAAHSRSAIRKGLGITIVVNEFQSHF